MDTMRSAGIVSCYSVTGVDWFCVLLLIIPPVLALSQFLCVSCWLVMTG